MRYRPQTSAIAGRAEFPEHLLTAEDSLRTNAQTGQAAAGGEARRLRAVPRGTTARLAPPTEEPSRAARLVARVQVTAPTAPAVPRVKVRFLGPSLVPRAGHPLAAKWAVRARGDRVAGVALPKTRAGAAVVGGLAAAAGLAEAVALGVARASRWLSTTDPSIFPSAPSALRLRRAAATVQPD